MDKLVIYPNKSLFHENETLEFVIITSSYPIQIKLVVTHLCLHVYEAEFRLTKPETLIKIPALPDNQSYGVFCEADGEIAKSAFEIYPSWKRVPRYGFLSDFATTNLDNTEFIETLLKLHINVVQYYDWMKKHEDLVSKTPEFTDLMGRRLNQDVVKRRIEICHEKNIANIAYGAIYGASNDFYENHKEWAFYHDEQSPVRFIDVFTIMNFTEKSPWQNHIINQFKAALNKLGFDGIHLDTYGSPKVARDYDQNIICLDEHFKPFINKVKESLIAADLPSDLIFNNVGSWPIEKTFDAKTSALYIEIWDPITSYQDIATLIRRVKSLTKEKELIISAYLKPYFNQNHASAINAHKFLHAIINSVGAHHLIMGENKKVLRTGYYCDYGSLTEDEFEEVKNYYDFNAEFSEILYDNSFDDVSLTHTFGDNLEFVLDIRCSVHAEKNKVFTVIKENKKRALIHLVNFQGIQDMRWNWEKQAPEAITNLSFEMLAIKEIESIQVVSPDQDNQEVAYQTKETSKGKIVSFAIQRLSVWNTIIINKKD